MEFYWSFILLNLVFCCTTEFGLASKNHGTIKRGESNLQLSSILHLSANALGAKIAIDDEMVFVFSAGGANNLELSVVNVTRSNASCTVEGLENNVISVAAANQNEQHILTIGYSKYIQIISVTMDHSDVSNRECASKENLQKIAFDGHLRSVMTFKAYAGQHGVQKLHMLVSVKLEQGFDKIVLFRWIGSAFHETDAINIKNLDKVSVLTLKSCASPLIFVIKTFSSGDKTNSIFIYKIDNFDQLELKQILRLNYTLVEPYMQNCDYYSFLTCNGNEKANLCVVYNSMSKIVDFSEVRRVGSEGLKSRLFYTENLVVNRDKSQRLFGVDRQLRTILELNSSKQTTGDLMDMYMWNTEDNRIALVAIYKEPEALAIELSYINSTKIPSVNGSTNSLEDKIRLLQGLIYSRKVHLDKIVTLANQPDNTTKFMNLNKTFIQGGSVMNVNLNYGNRSLPSRIYENYERLKEMYNGQNTVVSKFMNRIYVKKMHVNNLLYNKSIFSNVENDHPKRLVLNPSKVLTVKEIHTGRLVSSLKPNSSSHHIQEEFLAILQIFQSIKISNIILQQINDINYPQLYNTAFLKSRDNDIIGNLVISHKNESGSCYCQNLATKYLNQYNFDYLFTLTTDQKVQSNIYVPKFLVSNISVNSVNGLKTTTIALVGVNNSLNSVVQIKDFTISGNLELSTDMEASIADHLRTTRKLESFSQIYNGKVRIKGQLILNNIYTTAKAQKYSVGHGDMSKQIMPLVNLSRNFWMKSTSQKFSSPIEFSMPIHLLSLETEILNDKSLLKFILRTGDWKLLPHLYLNSVVIAGDFNTEVDLKRANFGWLSIEHLQDNLIRQSSKTAELYGKKLFIRRIKTMHLLSKNINSIVSDTLVQKEKHKNIQFTNVKHLDSLHVFEKFTVDRRMNIDTYNMHNLSHFFKSADYAHASNRPINLKSVLFMNHVQIVNVSADFINQVKIPGYDLELNHDMMENSRLLVFKENVDFQQDLKTKTLNNLYWDDYSSQLKLKSDTKSYVGGTKYFLRPIKISKNLKLDSINSVDFKRLLKYPLQKAISQTIGSSWKFHNLIIQNLSTLSKIDGIDVNRLAGSNTSIKLDGNLAIMSVRLRGNLIGSIHDESAVDVALKKLRDINGTNWEAVHIRSQANWKETNLNPVSDYELIQMYAMQSNSSQNIKGKVRFKAVPKFMVLSTIYPLDDVNLTNIVADYFGRKKLILPVTVVSASKYFETSLSVQADIKTIKHADFEAINNIDVLFLDQSIIHRESINFQLLFGEKSFSNIISATHLVTHGLVNNILPANLVHMNGSLVTLAPPTTFKRSEMSMHYITLNSINRIDFTAFLNKRLRIKGESQVIDGYLTFENLLTKKAMFSSINNCTLDRVVLKRSNQHQLVSGKKTFLNSLHVIGPSSVASVNGADLIDKFRNTTFANQFYKLKTVKIIGEGRIIFQRGVYISEDFPHEASELRPNNRIVKDLFTAVQGKTSMKTYPNISRRFLYVEYDKQTNDSSTFNDKSMDGLSDQENCANHFKISSYRRSTMSSKVIVKNDLNGTASLLDVTFAQKNDSLYFERNIKNYWEFSDKQPNVSYIIVEFAEERENQISFPVLRVDNLSMNISRLQKITISNNSHSIVTPQLYKSATGLFFFVGMEKLQVFRFDSGSETFKVSFSLELPWNRRHIVITNEKDTPYQIILANRGDRKLLVYIANTSIMYQIIHVPKPLEQFVTFHDFQSGRSSLVIVTRDNSFYLYMYSSNLEGWVHETNGVLNNISSVLCRYSVKDQSLWITSVPSQQELKGSANLQISARYYVQNGITND